MTCKSSKSEVSSSKNLKITVAFPFSNMADIIGFDWKYYDFGDNQYYIRPDLFFLLKDEKGFYYKVRMIDFYSQQGVKGTITLEYQRI